MGKEVKWQSVNELREKFLSFFESKDHLRLNSFSLVPHNDNSLLLINSGMAPLKPYFTGQEVPPRRRVTTCQKCIRTGDIENVGKTARHGTFFEMLGNFSFGDYFKTEAIHWSWEFLTEVVGLDPERLYPSVYLDDDEAFEIWNKEIGVSADRIYRFGKEDNFWEHGKGPCGPCSEIYYDRGEKYGTGPEDVMGGEGDRFMEIWNNVFTQFENDGEGNYTELSQKNIDTGMGLERLAVVVQDVDSIFDVDTLEHLRNEICKLAGIEYKQDPVSDISIRVITDHIRSVTMMVSDGILPSNEGRGYVLRRLLRRAARHGRLLKIDGLFLADLAKVVIADSSDAYPQLEEKKDFILSVIEREEVNFNDTIDRGLAILDEMIEDIKKAGVTELSGENAFKLYDTYGFPIDLTFEILEENGITVDMDGFKEEMEKQRQAARSARAESNYMGAEETIFDNMDAAICSEFDGYENLEENGKVLCITKREALDNDTYKDTEVVQALTEGEQGTIIVDKTPFYGTMGGQEGDIGIITAPDGEFKVTSTIHIKGGRIGHIGVVTSGMIKEGDTVDLKVDADNRANTCKNHSATHLLQAALKKVLGSHVEQKGSLVDGDRLRFDFSHFQGLTEDEIKETERIVNKAIADNIPVETKIMSLEDAKKTGAMALFGEKYGDEVRVVAMGDASIELCGGTHVKNTGNISNFKIISETGIAAGVRRIEALTGDALKNYYDALEEEIKEAASIVKSEPSMLLNKLNTLMEDMKKLRAENESIKAKLAASAVNSAERDEETIGDYKLIIQKLDGVAAGELRDLGDKIKNEIGSGVILIISTVDGNVNLLAMASDDAVKAGAHAGNLIKSVAGAVGGKGGGRPNMAQAGGKDAAGIDACIDLAKSIAKEQLG